MSDKSSTISITYKFKGDKSGLKDLVSEVEKMQQAFKDGIQPADQLRTSLINFNQVARSFEQIGASLGALNGVVQDLSRAYAEQEGAEVRLQTVMQQRMQATAEEIQGIKDLCSAQQELGVIGDEVQLAGAQQMATFLSTSNALQVLIPAMNNLVAQQKGLNATSSDTVAIANLMGKAMQGNASALRRVGITFSEAEEQALKTGDEFQRATVLAQIITNNVGEMNAALAQTDSGKAKQLSNALGDVKERIGGIVSGVAPYMTFVNAIIATTANAGRAAAAMRGLMSSCFGANGALKFVSTSAVASALGMNSAGVAARFLAAGLRMVMAATGVGLVIWGITAAVDAFTASAKKGEDAAVDMSKGVDRLKQAEDQMNQALVSARAQLEADIAATKNFNGTKVQEQKMIDELNQRYGDTMDCFSSISAWYNALTANSEAYCRQLIKQAKAQALVNEIAQKELDLDKLKGQLGSGAFNEIDFSKVDFGNPTSIPTKEGNLQKMMVEVSRGMAAEVEALKTQLADVMAEEIEMPVRGSARSSSTGTGSSATARKLTLLEQIEEQIRKNQAAALTANQQEYAELVEVTRQLVVQRDELRAKQEALVKAPETPYTPPQINEIKTYEQLDKAIQHYRGELAKAEGDARVGINSTILALEDLRKEWDEALNPTFTPSDLDNYIGGLVSGAKAKFASEGSPLKGMDLGSLLSGYSQIQNVLNGMDGDITAEQRASLEKAAEEYQKYAVKAAMSLDTIKGAWGSMKGMAGGINQMTEALKGSGNAWETIQGVIDGLIQTFEGLKSAISIVKALTAVSQGLTAAKTAEAAATATATTALTVSTATAETEAAAQAPVIASNKATAASFMELAAAAFFAAHAYVPFAGFGIASGFITASEAMVKSIGAMAFASGGIVSGPTLGLIGEYAGASSNPEVVAPLDKLRSMIGDTGRGVVVGGEFRVRGRDLVAVVANETRIASKSGKRTNIKI